MSDLAAAIPDPRTPGRPRAADRLPGGGVVGLGQGAVKVRPRRSSPDEDDRAAADGSSDGAGEPDSQGPTEPTDPVRRSDPGAPSPRTPRERRSTPVARDLGPSALGTARTLCLVVILLAGIADALVSMRPLGLSVNFAVTVGVGAAAWLVVLVHSRLPAGTGRVVVALMGLSVWCGLSMAWSIAGFSGAQLVFALTSFAGLVAVGSIAGSRLDARFDALLRRALVVAGIVLVVLWLQTAYVGIPGLPAVSDRGAATTAVVLVAGLMARVRLGDRTAVLVSMALIAVTGLSLSRAGLVAALVVAILAVPRRTWGERARLMVLVVTAAIALVVLVNHFAPLHDRFFTGDLSGEVAGVRFNVSGRIAFWDIAADTWRESPIGGRGLGAVTSRIAEQFPDNFATIGHPHNDYLRLMGDTGLVGLGLFVAFAVSTVAGLRVPAPSTRRARRAANRTVAPGEVDVVAARLVLLGVLILMVTDNVITYSFVLSPAGVLIGVGLGRAAWRRAHLARPSR
ncbi:MAG: O-antigen ligase family protein [Acidimicrobiales bacterium]|nr:O-antigen ligase family protein [Acidimicrobiales bacterium]